jgi:hypothetical protein
MFSMDRIRTAYPNCSYNSWCAVNEWSANVYSDGIVPVPTVAYFDDASIVG